MNSARSRTADDVFVGRIGGNRMRKIGGVSWKRREIQVKPSALPRPDQGYLRPFVESTGKVLPALVQIGLPTRFSLFGDHSRYTRWKSAPRILTGRNLRLQGKRRRKDDQCRYCGLR